MNNHNGLRNVAAILAIALVFTALPALSQVPNPTVTGPILQNAPPGDPSHDYTFFTSEILSGFGYVEEEFFITGMANVYNTPPLTTGTIVSSNHPYKTRIVVRRPADAKRFNGTVVLEWLNVSAGFDLDARWQAGSGDHLMRQGYAWVGVSAQRVGIHQPGTGLRHWRPVRYGTLDVTDGGTLVNDQLAFDIFSQAGQAVMNPVGVDPLGGLKPERIVATGGSQSAARLGIYYNSIQPLANLFDAFLLVVANPTVRTDIGVPVFKLHSETEAVFIALGVPFPPSPPLQPDSDTHRTWQVAGTSHIDGTLIDNLRPIANRDAILLPPLGLCAFPEGSRVPFHHVDGAALDHVVRWVTDGTPPPTAPLITTIGSSVPRDGLGLVLGGIRLAALEVPTALNTGLNGGPFFCPLSGTHIAFDQAQLDELYPNHGSYVNAVQAVVLGNLAAGYITLRDAQTTVTAAAKSGIGHDE